MTAARRLGRYSVGERIGTGGVADVFLAEAGGAEGLSKSVVLKCLRPHVADIPEVVEALIEEARLAQRLQHGSIVQVFDFEVDDGVPFVVMEHVDGCTLRELTKDLRRREERMPLEAALFVVEQVAAALGYAHRLVDADGMPMDVVHRDVKPSNILLSREGLVKLADFGIAKVADRGRETLPGVLKGTPTYWAPEQAAGDPVDARADVYGLGVVLRELVSGAPNDTGGDDPPEEVDHRVDDELVALIDEATAERAADRVPSMRELSHRLHDWAADRRVRVSGEPVATLVRRAKRDKPAAVRVALDSALLSTAKGDATVQRGSSTAAVIAPQSNWRWPALAGVGAAALAAAVVFGIGSGPAAADKSEPDPSTPVADPPQRTAAPSSGATEPARAGAEPRAAPKSQPEPEPEPTPTSGSPGDAGDPATAPAPAVEPAPVEPKPGPAVADTDSAPPDETTGAAAAPTKVRKHPAKARKGRVKVNTLPWAEVSIDGKSYGRVPVEVSLPVGRHRIVLSNPSMGTRERVVTVTRGSEVSVTRWPN